MAKQIKPVQPDDWVSAKVRKSTLDAVKAHKDETYVPIHVFIDEAVKKELKRLKRL